MKISAGNVSKNQATTKRYLTSDVKKTPQKAFNAVELQTFQIKVPKLYCLFISLSWSSSTGEDLIRTVVVSPSAQAGDVSVIASKQV